MHYLSARLLTSAQRSATQRLHTLPTHIAAATFLFTVDGDHPKYWYYGGGIYKWLYKDDPWVEHTKLFPTCKFLLQKKGPRFFRLVLLLQSSL